MLEAPVMCIGDGAISARSVGIAKSKHDDWQMDSKSGLPILGRSQRRGTRKCDLIEVDSSSMTAAASLLIATLLSTPAAPPAGGVLQISGALPKSGSLSIADLEAMGPVSSTWTLHGEKHEVYGVPLDKVLSRFGFEPGPMGKSLPKQEKRKGFRMVVIATAADGFQSVLSCAEVFESMGPTKALLVWKIDGKPIPAEQGPLRLVVVTDKEPSRSIYGVRALEVVEPRGAQAPSTLR